MFLSYEGGDTWEDFLDGTTVREVGAIDQPKLGLATLSAVVLLYPHFVVGPYNPIGSL